MFFFCTRGKKKEMGGKGLGPGEKKKKGDGKKVKKRSGEKGVTTTIYPYYRHCPLCGASSRGGLKIMVQHIRSSFTSFERLTTPFHRQLSDISS